MLDTGPHSVVSEQIKTPLAVALSIYIVRVEIKVALKELSIIKLGEVSEQFQYWYTDAFTMRKLSNCNNSLLQRYPTHPGLQTSLTLDAVGRAGLVRAVWARCVHQLQPWMQCIQALFSAYTPTLVLRTTCSVRGWYWCLQHGARLRPTGRSVCHISDTSD